MQLISEGYRQEQEALHAKGNYGTASLQYGRVISELVEQTGSETLLDYGCGSMQNLKKVLDCDVLYLSFRPKSRVIWWCASTYWSTSSRNFWRTS
jgi:hypothetical protein